MMQKLVASLAMMLNLTASVASEGFFVDWSTSLCVESCLGDPPCAGRKNHPWEELFASFQQCRNEGLPWKGNERLGGGSTGTSEIFFID